jgi:hypothetical protein
VVASGQADLLAGLAETVPTLREGDWISVHLCPRCKIFAIKFTRLFVKEGFQDFPNQASLILGTCQ